MAPLLGKKTYHYRDPSFLSPRLAAEMRPSFLSHSLPILKMKEAGSDERLCGRYDAAKIYCAAGRFIWRLTLNAAATLPISHPVTAWQVPPVAFAAWESLLVLAAVFLAGSYDFAILAIGVMDGPCGRTFYVHATACVLKCHSPPQQHMCYHGPSGLRRLHPQHSAHSIPIAGGVPRRRLWHMGLKW